MLGSSWVAAQFTASQEGLSSMSDEWCVLYKRVFRFFIKRFCIMESFGACNTWHSCVVSGVIKRLGSLSIYFLLVKFTFLLYSSVIDSGEQRVEKWKYGNSGETGEKFLCFVHQSHGLPLQLQRTYFSFNGRTTRHLYRSLDAVCIQFSVTSSWIRIL
jgi:hypothetical protein